MECLAMWYLRQTYGQHLFGTHEIGVCVCVCVCVHTPTDVFMMITWMHRDGGPDALERCLMTASRLLRSVSRMFCSRRGNNQEQLEEDWEVVS